MNCSIGETWARGIKQIVPMWPPTVHRFAVLITKKSWWDFSVTIWISAYRAKWGVPVASNGCYSKTLRNSDCNCIESIRFIIRWRMSEK